MNKPVAIVLGGTTPHKILIENLKNRGYKTLLIDYTNNPPAASAADIHIKESTLDTTAVEKIALQHKAKLIISAALDQPLPISISISEKLGLPVPFDSKTANTLTNKIAMKQVMDENGIPTPAWHFFEKSTAPDLSHLKYPIVIKPEDGTGSKGVFILNTELELELELEHTLEEAFNASSTGKVIAEEFITGIELSIDCVVSHGISNILLLRERYKCDINGDPKGTQCVATLSPAKITEDQYNALSNIVSRAASAFNIKNGVLLLQAIINPKSEIFIIEIAGRVSGGPGGVHCCQAQNRNRYDRQYDKFISRT